ncbi:hypothetical protein L484_012088 [Morus notabilis]|uniref:Uncharacterized protein n=1 Tax=Morus notabilis TaxID=981085 RepID=W9SEN8_9ROSA|nr:hypothetical protein L484_012088 [Morus notabilis]
MKKNDSTVFCNISGCSNAAEDNCSSWFLAIIDRNSCLNHILVISFDILLLHRVISKKTSSSVLASRKVPPLSVFSAIFNGSNYANTYQEIGDIDASYGLLQDGEADDEGETSPNGNVTPFARSGLLSTISFWWLNPLMKKGKEKVLQDEDIPKLKQEDRAQTMYSMFTEQLNKKKLRGSSDPPSILSTIILCQGKAIFVCGFVALIKVLTLASNPLFLSAFTRVVEGNSAFKYEGYALTAGLFLVKIMESLSERQWYFRSPPTLTLLVLVMLGSSPLAKLQHDYQAKFMVAQNERLKDLSEALTKLYSSNVFTFLATLRLIQEPIRLIPDIFNAFVEAKVSFARIAKFLEAHELENRKTRQDYSGKVLDQSVIVRCSEISWDTKPGEKLAICGEVGSGKSTLLAAILGEVPHIMYRSFLSIR